MFFDALFPVLIAVILLVVIVLLVAYLVRIVPQANAYVVERSWCLSFYMGHRHSCFDTVH